MTPPSPVRSDDDDEDEAPKVSKGRRIFRYAQVAIYLGFAVAIPVYMFHEGKMAGTMVVFTWLMAGYMAARALAIYVKFRQETRPPRYTRAYAEARDLLSTSDDDDDSPEPEKQNGSTHG